MKRLLISSLMLMGLLTGCGYNKGFLDYFQSKCQMFEELLEVEKGCDIDFIGDSITDLYNVEDYFPEYKVANRGIGGDTTDMLLTRLDISAYKLNPKVISLLIGTNNLDTCMNDYEVILNNFKTHLPNTKVAVLSILPRRGKDLCEKIVENNAQIKNLTNKYEYTYVDLYESFTEDEELLVDESLFDDGLHPNKKGYQVMSDALKPIFANFLN